MQQVYNDSFVMDEEEKNMEQLNADEDMGHTRLFATRKPMPDCRAIDEE